MIEEWRAVPGYAGLYEVSSAGRVRSLDRIMTSPTAKRGYPRRMLGRILTPVVRRPNKYLTVSLHEPDGHRETRYVAHLVAEAFIGVRPKGCEVCHCNGDPTDNRASNLRYDTHLGNEADKVVHGTRPFGERAGSSRLTEKEVREIRRLSVTTDHGAIAKRFGVSRNAVDYIVNRRIWAHLPPVDGERGTPSGEARFRDSMQVWFSARSSAVNQGQPVPVRGEGEPS